MPKPFVSQSHRIALCLLALVPFSCYADLLVSSPDGLFRFDGKSGDLAAIITTTANYRALTFGPGGDLYALDREQGRIDRYAGSTFNATGTFTEHGSLEDARDFAFGPDGRLYVAAGASVERFDAAGDYQGPFVPEGTGGLELSAGVAFGPGGVLHVADRNGGNILRFNGDDGAFAGVVTTRTGFPGRLRFDTDGNLFVPDDGEIAAIVHFRGEDRFLIGFFQEPGAPAALDSPVDSAPGPSDGLLYVADRSGQILRLDADSGGVIDVFSTLSSAKSTAEPSAIAFSQRPSVEEATFDEWRTMHFTEDEVEDDSVSGPGADPYGSGLPNLLRYSLGLGPAESFRGRTPGIEVRSGGDDAGTVFSFTRPRNLGEVRYVIQSSRDLDQWSDIPEEPETLRVENLGETERISIRQPDSASEDGGVRFFRLRVEHNP